MVHHRVRHYQDAILAALDALGSASAMALFHHLRRHGIPLGLSTVYRTLHVLVAAGAIYALPLLDEIVYEKATETIVDAFSCVVCKHTVRILRSDAHLGAWRDDYFLTMALPLAVRGVCATCAVPQASSEYPPHFDAA